MASTVAALAQPDVLKALHTAVVGPAEDVAAVERLAGLMAGIMVETPAALLGKIEQGWTQAPEGASEGAWGELLATCLRPRAGKRMEEGGASPSTLDTGGEGGSMRGGIPLRLGYPASQQKGTEIASRTPLRSLFEPRC